MCWEICRYALGYGYGHNMLYGDGTEISWDDAMEVSYISLRYYLFFLCMSSSVTHQHDFIQIRRTISRQSWIYDHQVMLIVIITVCFLHASIELSSNNFSLFYRLAIW